MFNIEKLLQYQAEDEKLLNIEKEVSNSVERKNLAQAVNFVTKANERLEILDGKARGLDAAVTELEKKYEEVAETLAEFDNIDEMLEGGADISFYKKNITQILERLKSIRQELGSLQKSVRESDEEFQSLYQKNRAMQKQGKEYQDAYEKYRDKKRAESDEIKKELVKLSKEIDPEIMQRYQAKRSERIFPILCPEKNGRCSACFSELSLMSKEKLTSGGYVECDNCHRFLYKE